MNKLCQLFIDTTANFCYVGIYNLKNKIDEIKIKVNKNVTDIIVESIWSLLEKNSLTYENINELYLNIGPGSFTGVRVGVLIAKAWSNINQTINIFAIDSLLLQTTVNNSISIIDAKSNKSYLAIYQNFKPIQAPNIYNNVDIRQIIANHKELIVFENQTDKSYDNFIFHKNHFKPIRVEDLQPLYIKLPL